MLGYLPQFMYPLTIIQSSIQLGLPLIVFPSILPFMMDLKRDLSLSLGMCPLSFSHSSHKRSVLFYLPYATVPFICFMLSPDYLFCPTLEPQLNSLEPFDDILLSDGLY